MEVSEVRGLLANDASRERGVHFNCIELEGVLLIDHCVIPYHDLIAVIDERASGSR